MAFLTIDHVSFHYHYQKQILHQVNLEIKKGKFHCLLGRSGCGKTTLLKIVAGLLQPTKGMVYKDGVKVIQPAYDSGFVFQSPTLLEWKTVLDNLLLPISLKRKTTKDDRERALALLQTMGMAGFENDYPTELSGGQQSRVAIARALITNPSLLFLDEPFAALDALTREELQDDLLTLCRMYRTTVLFITHDIEEAVYLSDSLSVMQDGRVSVNLNNVLNKPRTASMRYDSAFSSLCRKLREAIMGEKV